MLTAALFVFTPGPAHSSVLATSGDAYVVVEGTVVKVGNALIERSFDADGGAYGTVELLDKVRAGNRWEGAGDYPTSPALEPQPVGWRLTSTQAEVMSNGAIEATLELAKPGLTVERSVRVLPGIAALRMQTTLLPTVSLALTDYDLERLRASSPYDPDEYTARGIGFNGGADWHDLYDYRRDTTGPSFETNAEWLDVQGPSGALAMLMERRNYHSSRMAWTSQGEAVAGVDFGRDLLYLGPIEPYSVPSPLPASGRARIVPPGGRLDLEPVIVALGADVDEAAWPAHKMLATDKAPYTNTVNFNTDRVHTPGIDIGARDGVDFAVFQQLLPIAKALGVETFVLDDGWQKYNGDWKADPARYNETKGEGLDAVRQALEAEGMRLGLWMAPGAFHPNSVTFKEHPEWACIATGAGTAAANALDPNGDHFLGGSAAPGIGLWNLEAVGPAGAFKDKLRTDIDNLVTTYSVAEFKFDFLVWVDCANPKPATIYDYRDAFFSTIDSLSAEHSGVGFGVDETNDFRSFPFESILRGPTWFQNGNPSPDALLHNVWTLAPFVPGSAIGQAVTIPPTLTPAEIDERMAIALAYHPTFWTDIRTLDGKTELLARVNEWTGFFKDHRDLSGFAYPLLDDPLGGGRWSGLQPWNADADAGFAMLYRLGAPNETQTVELRGLPDAMSFTITDERSGEILGTFTSAQLRTGIDVTITHPRGARILRIEPV